MPLEHAFDGEWQPPSGNVPAGAVHDEDGDAVVGFLYAEQLQKTIEDFEAGNSMQDANAALERGGREELLKWRDGTPRDDGGSAEH